MGKLFHVFTIVLAVFHAVQDAEARMPAAAGTNKLRSVLDTVGAVASTAGVALGVPAPAGALDAALGGIASGVVGLLNHFGVFQHTSPKSGT